MSDQSEEVKHYDPKAGMKLDGFVGTINRFRINPWVQVLVIAFVCFCCPGMYNALTGTGGGGQVDPTVNANASIALLSCTAVTAIFIAGPLLAMLGPRNSLLLSGWTYALYSGALLNYTKEIEAGGEGNAAFVIGAGAVLGIGSSFLWVAQGAIMTSYIPESHKGRSIAIFWFIFNIGGAIGSLISFGLNYDGNDTGTVSDSTYIAFMVIMLVGWILSVLICSPKHVANREMLHELGKDNKGLDDDKRWDTEKLKRAAVRLVKVVTNYKFALLIPFCFSANVFYPYQQSIVNGYTFNIRTRSLNGALYWIAQMVGGLVMGGILDMLPVDRKKRGIAGWIFLLCTTMAIWGGGYKFQVLIDERHARGLAEGTDNEFKYLQNIDFKDGSEFLGPMFLYFFYGAFDSFWQGYIYWLMGAISNSAYDTGVMVGLYKGTQATGGAMANKLLAHPYPWMTQFGVCWGLSVGSLLICVPSVLSITLTNVTEELSDEEGDGETQLKAATSPNDEEKQIPQQEA